jgi:hypothetical protein
MRGFGTHVYMTSNISAASFLSRVPNSPTDAFGARNLGLGYFSTLSTVNGDSHSSFLPASYLPFDAPTARDFKHERALAILFCREQSTDWVRKETVLEADKCSVQRTDNMAPDCSGKCDSTPRKIVI